MSIDARGQNRTTNADWTSVAPYIRFRYERALENLPQSGRVFELGCGIGVGLSYLAVQRPDLKFTGFDSSAPAIAAANEAFGSIRNIAFFETKTLDECRQKIENNTFLIAFEVIEHFDQKSYEYFKDVFMTSVEEVVFSFPYDEPNIDGVNHLRSLDVYDTFEMFPGFRVLFLRRGSIKFIGHWKRQKMPFIGQEIGVRGERDAIKRISNWI